jgi:hypothetical protein
MPTSSPIPPGKYVLGSEQKAAERKGKETKSSKGEKSEA